MAKILVRVTHGPENPTDPSIEPTSTKRLRRFAAAAHVNREGLMNNSPSDYRAAWVREYLAPRHPDLVGAYLEACSIYESGKTSGSLDEADAERLLAYARSSRAPLGENAATMLGELCAGRSALGAAIRSLATSRRVHERVNALVALHSCPPTELHVELLAFLLRDKSARVRTLAAEKIVHHRIEQLANALEEAAARETNVAVANQLRAELDYLHQGFHARREGEIIWVTCRPPSGASVSKLFTLKEYQTAGSAWISNLLSQASDEA
jgi:hypothetical protein